MEGQKTRVDFREALAATVAKSQEDRRVFELLFDRYFFRAAESEALERGIGEDRRYDGGEGLDLNDLREAVRQAIADGRDGLLVPVTPLTPAKAGETIESAAVRFRTVGDITCTCPANRSMSAGAAPR